MKKNLYVLGDSFSYGLCLPDRNKCWGKIFTNIEEEYHLVNLSIPGGSNWRISRTIHSLNLNQEDLVIIGWTISNRFEFGLSPYNDIGKNKNFSIEDNLNKYPFINKRQNNEYTHLFFEQISDRVDDNRVKYFSELVYDQFYNEKWFDEYFRIFYWSVRNILERSKVKWLMFDTWCPSVNDDTPWKNELKHDNYFYIGDNNMDRFLSLRYENIHIKNSGYWNENGHFKVCNLLLDQYQKIYD